MKHRKKTTFKEDVEKELSTWDNDAGTVLKKTFQIPKGGGLRITLLTKKPKHSFYWGKDWNLNPNEMGTVQVVVEDSKKMRKLYGKDIKSVSKIRTVKP